MRIAVILPGPAVKPIGGYQILYEYCSRISSLDNSIYFNFIYKYFLPYSRFTIRNALKVFYYRTLNKNFYSWFNFRNKENISHQVETIFENWNDYDAIIVSAVQTAHYINSLQLNKPVIYFIQHFEDWDVSVNVLKKSFLFPFKKVVVSNWIKKEIKATGNNISHVLINPIEEVFKCSVKQEKRVNKSILFMYHKAEWKGSKETIACLEMLKNADMEVNSSCFSVYDKPPNFPEWIKYYYRPTKKEISELYNKHKFFLSLSYKEGFGLTAAEAMACGCCLICTMNGGVEDFAKNNFSSILVSSPPIPEQIVKKIIEILNDHPRINKLSQNAISSISHLDWNIKTEKFLNILIDTINEYN